MPSLIKGAYQLAFQLSPIMLTGGVFTGVIPGLPILSILQGIAVGNNVFSSTNSVSLDQPWLANFRPLPGSTLISNQMAQYPFASQAIAANAILSTPLTVSMLMTIPAQATGGFAVKTAAMMALQATLRAHIDNGGTFTVLTPSYIYTGCILLDLRDASQSNQAQVQTDWVWDFAIPLTQPEGLHQVLNNLMSKLEGNLPSDNLWSSISTAIGGTANSIGSGISNILGGL